MSAKNWQSLAANPFCIEIAPEAIFLNLQSSLLHECIFSAWDRSKIRFLSAFLEFNSSFFSPQEVFALQI
jgi:hypothetical protein